MLIRHTASRVSGSLSADIEILSIMLKPRFDDNNRQGLSIDREITALILFFLGPTPSRFIEYAES